MKEIVSTRNFTDDYLKKILDTLKNWKIKISNNENFSFIKFGDGELISMAGEEGRKKYDIGDLNCDKHSYSKGDLSSKLIDAWIFLNEHNNKYDNIYFAEWTAPKLKSATIPKNENSLECKTLKKLENIDNFNIHYVNYEILLQNTLSQEKYDFFKELKYTKRKKVFVGPERLHDGVSNWLKIDKCIKVPLENVIDEYDRILNDIYKEIKKNCIIFFSCSMPANSFIHRALEKEKEITCLDIGSGFDMMFHRRSREGQLEKENLLKYYEGM